MDSQSLTVNGKAFTFEEILSDPQLGQTVFERSTFTFLRNWLNNESHFTLQTSGSTGEPKLMSVSREQMKASATATINFLNLKPGETALVCLDTRYVAGMMMLVRCLVGKMNAVVIEPAGNPLQAIESSLDFMAVVPYQLGRMVAETRERLNSVRTCIVGGGSIDQELISQVKNLNTNIYSTYGMTETLSHVAMQKVSGDQSDKHYTALPGVLLAQDERNCLVISTPYLDKPVITNDVVELIDNQHFRWIGRWDNIINSGGIKVTPEIIEQSIQVLLARLNISNRFFIGPLPDPALGQRVCLFIEHPVLSQEQLLNLQRLLRDELPNYHAPKEIRQAEKFAETPTGKINRKATIDLFPV